MKKLITLSLSIHIALISFSQTNNFAPIGATWYYDDYVNNCITFPDCGYYKMESVGDTLIDGKNCRILKETYFMTYFKPDTQYIIYEDLGIVYLFDEGAFHELYNFNAVAGDTITTFAEPFNGYYSFSDFMFSEFKYVIDSVYTELIDGELLRIQNTTALGVGDGWGFWSGPMIIEKIGSIGMFLGIPNEINIEYGGFLRCYSEDGFFYKNPDYDNDCDFITEVSDQIQKSFEIFPNPVQNYFILETAKELDVSKLKLTNACGQNVGYKISPENNNRFKIDLGNIEPGLYFLNCEDFSAKIIKL